MASWRTGTTKSYKTYLTRWEEFCHKENLNTYNPGKIKAIEFLTELYNSGLGYSAINTARSALSTVIVPEAGITFGKDPLVCRFLKGVFELKPSLPKYQEIWDVNNVLLFFKQISSIQTISLKDLTINLATLLCLLTAQRCQTIHKIDLSYMQFYSDHCIITINEVLKHTKAGKHQKPLILQAYPNDKKICVLEYLKEYLNRTSGLRREQTQLLISYTKPHNAVTKDTVARWVKTVLQSSGIDTKKFTCHSTRAASSSYAKAAGINLLQIMQSAGWSNTKTFAKFYDKPIITANPCSTVLTNTDREVPT